MPQLLSLQARCYLVIQQGQTPSARAHLSVVLVPRRRTSGGHGFWGGDLPLACCVCAVPIAGPPFFLNNCKNRSRNKALGSPKLRFQRPVENNFGASDPNARHTAGPPGPRRLRPRKNAARVLPATEGARPGSRATKYRSSSPGSNIVSFAARPEQAAHRPPPRGVCGAARGLRRRRGPAAPAQAAGR